MPRERPGARGAPPEHLPGVPRAVADRLSKLGIQRPFDLVLHLPLRYEDETRVQAIAEARHGTLVQVEGVVIDCDVKFRPRRQLVARIRDEGGELTVRLLHFYPSQQKQLAPDTRVRLVGEIRQGFFGAEMVHPRIKVVNQSTPLPEKLTPVYPTTAGLSQYALTRAVAGALATCELDDTLPEAVAKRLRLPAFESAVRLLHDPPVDVALDALEQKTHPAWLRIKFDELLAQQLSMRLHRRERDAARAPVLADGGHSRSDCSPRCRSCSRVHSSACSRRSAPISNAPIRCSACCRVMWAAARPSSPHSPRWPRSKAVSRWR